MMGMRQLLDLMIFQEQFFKRLPSTGIVGIKCAGICDIKQTAIIRKINSNDLLHILLNDFCRAETFHQLICQSELF